jgi:hypothetical protein
MTDDPKVLHARVEMLEEQLIVEQKQRQKLATTVQQLRSDLRSQASAFSSKGVPRRSSSAAAIELRMDLSQFETIHTTVAQRLTCMAQQLRDREKVQRPSCVLRMPPPPHTTTPLASFASFPLSFTTILAPHIPPDPFFAKESVTELPQARQVPGYVFRLPVLAHAHGTRVIYV